MQVIKGYSTLESRRSVHDIMYYVWIRAMAGRTYKGRKPCDNWLRYMDNL